MVGGAFTATLLLVLGQAQWHAGLRAEGRALSEAAGDLQLDPSAGIQSASRDVLLRAEYTPRLLFRSPRSRGTFEFLHRAELSAAFRLDRDTGLVLAQRGSVGAVNLSWVAFPADAPPPVNVQATTNVPTIPSIDEHTTVTVTRTFTSRLRGSVTGGFGLTGALHAEDTTIWPRTLLARLGVSGTWTQHRDTFGIVPEASHGWVTGGYTTYTVGASAGWRHAFSQASETALTQSIVAVADDRLGPRYETELRAGLSFLGGTSPYQQVGVAPRGEVTLWRQAPPTRGAVGARVGVRYAPEVDPTTGGLRTRLEASAHLDLRLDRQIVASVGGGLGYYPEPIPLYPRQVSQAGVGLTYEVSRWVAIAAGVRVAHLPATEWAGVVTTTLAQRGRL